MSLTESEVEVLDAATEYARKWEKDPLRVSIEGRMIIWAVRKLEGKPMEYSDITG